MGVNVERILIELFPESEYRHGGLDNGKWQTDHFMINFKAAFYTIRKTGKTHFVNGQKWKEELHRLKELSEKLKHKEADLIGKEYVSG